MTQTELRAAADVHAQIWFQLDGSTMFTAAALHSLLMVALCLVSWAVPHGRHPGDLHGEEKESSSSLMDRSRASDSSSLISSSQTSAADSTEAGDAHVPDSDFSSRPLDAPDTWTEADRLQTEEPDEDEEEEEVDSDEEESEEDLTESTMAPPYSLIPPPPVWVQRNQGLVRSWVELIREKAGYVSGMLAPVGIGIAGALLLVGALYSIRAIHRRRNSFKHQRRKPPREVRSGPDNAMLLADSSEDEF
ncbi:armadillo-like helical domain-containing protein 4 isoform X3 [Carassius auratus]|uniref:Armadillo-like helical domain-containing protein 4 isoform X3 n=1 Tax=Carassius auratus TaxID=7957 RepID=A0A6P6N7U4_CARAU|nr:armadillo-like helical domain-containing protein 4 isoform X3 [Carassius auratus]